MRFYGNDKLALYKAHEKKNPKTVHRRNELVAAGAKGFTSQELYEFLQSLSMDKGFFCCTNQQSGRTFTSWPKGKAKILWTI